VKAKALGLWNMWMPVDSAEVAGRSGAGLTNLQYGGICEILGICCTVHELHLPRHRQYGAALTLRDRAAETRLAGAAARGRDPQLLRDDRAQRCLLCAASTVPTDFPDYCSYLL
jgi:hypothetical protein